MPSKRRIQSSSGFYHVFHRGVNHFDIFEDNEDRQLYLELLRKCARALGVEIHAWCLMSNHVHMLLRADHDALSAFMRQVASSYARSFNARHLRCGPLFGGRFESVCVETNEQLMTVVRYIHRNPIHHEEAALCGNYRWSSFGEYVAGSPDLCKLGFVLGLFGGIDFFSAFHREEGESERHLDIGTLGRMSDEEARWRANAALVAAGISVKAGDVGKLPRKLRDEALVCIKRVVGCSLRQLQRLTAIAYSAIRGAVSQGGEDGRSIQEELPVSPVGELRASLELPAARGASRRALPVRAPISLLEPAFQRSS